MDYEKIGNFIMNERKALKLTQSKLADKLFVSEKTISKWENGNGVPDTATLPKICEIFNVSINELLNGERIESSQYVNKAENKLLDLQKQREVSDSRLLFVEIVLGVLTMVACFTLLLSAVYIIETFNEFVVPIIMIVICILILVFGIVVALRIEQKAGYYECRKCGHKYVPTYSQVVWAMHVNRTRYMKCPKCNKHSWNRKVIK